MKVKTEVCVDNLESVIRVNSFPVDRIELCAALSVGGITPSFGFIQQALAISTIPLALMIRPRAGDFVYNEAEIQVMLNDIQLARSLGIKTVVFGALTAQAEIDIATTARLMEAANGMTITFHRAFDLCRDPFVGLAQLIALGCTRILTSGQASTAFEGINLLAKLVNQAQGQIQIMAGCGINAENSFKIVQHTAVPEIHFSAKRIYHRTSPKINSVHIGNKAEQDGQISMTDTQELSAILTQLEKEK